MRNLLRHTTLLLILALALASQALAQLTIDIASVPATTPANDPIYIAGNFNSWDPGAAAYQLTNQGGGHYTITLPATVRGSIEFKFTRGTWPKGEVAASGASVGNRSYNVPATGTATYSGAIAGWQDLTTAPSTASPSVSIMSTNFRMPQLNRTRRIWLYLPPDYTTSAKTYPVLYMHDGQNLFDASTSFSGEWGVDETLDNLQRNGDWGCIVVGIDNGPNRLDEYSPYRNPQYGGGQGDEYIDFIINTLKPHVDSVYRTRPDRLNTGIAGSSMGGLISFYAALKRPDVFGRAGVLSPSLWFNDSIYSFAHRAQPLRPDPRMYMISGTAESSSQVRDQTRMVDTLTLAGFTAAEVDAHVQQGGTHSESYWKQQFPAVYRYLFASTTAVKDKQLAYAFNLVPNPVDSNHDMLTVQFEDATKAPKTPAELIDATGHVLQTAKLRHGKAQFSVRALPAGGYRVRVGQAVKAWVKR